MCLTVYSNRVRYKKAKEDIVVFKRLKKKSNLSPYKSFKYEENKEYTSGKLKAWAAWNKNTWHIDEGLHAYRTLWYARMKSNSYGEKEKIVEMIIPKGTRYVVNDEEIVAEKMVTGSLKGIKR